MKKSWLWLSLVLVAALAACNSNNSNPNVNPTPGPTCNTQGVTTQLVYPAPGSTAIPDQFGQVIVGSTSALPSSWDVVITAAVLPAPVAGNTFTTATPPFPTPNATPSFANPQYQSSSFGSLALSGQVVQVYLNNTATNCTPAGPIGSFTTQ